jgi:hypothetical protein
MPCRSLPKRSNRGAAIPSRLSDSYGWEKYAFSGKKILQQGINRSVADLVRESIVKDRNRAG